MSTEQRTYVVRIRSLTGRVTDFAKYATAKEAQSAATRLCGHGMLARAVCVDEFGVAVVGEPAE